MIDAWIRVRANLSKTRVAKKLAPICKRVNSDTQKAAGVLQDFWSGASQFSKDGFIRDEDDQTLEDWANWKGKPGIFANWVRTQHMDADGRINDWDEYMGVLESKRAKDRERKRLEREKKKVAASNGTSHGPSNGSHADSRRDVRTHDTERDVTERNETEVVQDLKPSRVRAKKPREASGEQPSWVVVLTAHWSELIGDVEHGRVGKRLKRLVVQYGETVVKAAIQAYSEEPMGTRPRTLEDFAGNFQRWRKESEIPIVKDGVTTPRGERLSRPGAIA